MVLTKSSRDSHDSEVWFGIVNGKVVVEHGIWFVGIEKSKVVMVGKGKRKTSCTYKKKTTPIRTSKLN